MVAKKINLIFIALIGFYSGRLDPWRGVVGKTCSGGGWWARLGFTGMVGSVANLAYRGGHLNPKMTTPIGMVGHVAKLGNRGGHFYDQKLAPTST